MKRFTAGLLLGSASAGIAYACGASPLWTALIGAVVAALVWFGGWVFEALADAVTDLT